MPRDVEEWDHALTHGTTVAATTDVEDPDRFDPSGAATGDPALAVLPIVVLGDETGRLFAASAALRPGDRVVALVCPADDPVPEPATPGAVR